MLISDIRPYERNARRNKKAIPAVAESIREFGFKGTIVLRSHDDPTIVCGHTRVEACRALGWTELPDDYITWCDDLTDDEVKALRIADNKTGDIATYNISMLKSELNSIKGLDMSRFGCNLKSKSLEYGAERLKTDRAYNLDIVNRADCGAKGFPELPAADAAPGDLVGFNYALSTPDDRRAGAGCHFFIDDYQFERVWTSPRRYLDALRGYDCVLTPDFSLYMDMPAPMQAWNRYRSQALGKFWADQGLTVVPTLSWAQPESYAFAFQGIPRRSTVAVSTVGVKGDRDALAVWEDGMAAAVRRLRPTRVLLYGGDVGFDFGRAEVIEYKNSVTERMANGR